MAHSHTPTPVSLRTHVTNGYIDNDPVRVEIVAGALDGDVTVINDETNPIPMDETLYSSIDIDMVTIPYGDGVTGIKSLPSDTCKGFLLMAARTNTSSVWVGSSADKCYIELPPGGRKDYALANPNDLFILNSDATPGGPLDLILVIERYY